MFPLEVTACWTMAITHPGLHHTGRCLCLSLTPPSSSLSLPQRQKEERCKGEEQSSLPSFSSVPGLDFLPSDPSIYCDRNENWTERNARGSEAAAGTVAAVLGNLPRAVGIHTWHIEGKKWWPNRTLADLS